MSKKQKKEWYEDVGFKLTVIEDGLCRAYQKKGQQFILKDYTTPAGLCIEVAHAIYPLLFAMRLDGDVRKLGSPNRESRVFTCPSRVIKYQVDSFYQCNICGMRVKQSELFPAKKKFGDTVYPIKVCAKCLQGIEAV